MENNKSNNLAVCIICGALTAIGIVASIISLANGSKEIWIISDAINLLLFVFVGYYTIWGYKKPNGNLLKYIILVFACTYLIVVYRMVQSGNPGRAVCYAVIIGSLCYIAGRLHRVKQNTILMIIMISIMVISKLGSFANGKATIGIIADLIIGVDICVAYIIRYKEHKEAGFINAPRK